MTTLIRLVTLPVMIMSERNKQFMTQHTKPLKEFDDKMQEAKEVGNHIYGKFSKKDFHNYSA